MKPEQQVTLVKENQEDDYFTVSSADLLVHHLSLHVTALKGIVASALNVLGFMLAFSARWFDATPRGLIGIALAASTGTLAFTYMALLVTHLVDANAMAISTQALRRPRPGQEGAKAFIRGSRTLLATLGWQKGIGKAQMVLFALWALSFLSWLIF